MSNFSSREIHKLRSYYDKKLKACHAYNFKMVDNNLEYFVTYLKFLRDYFMLTEPTVKDKKNLKVNSLVAAVSEYEKYNNCILNYYKVDSNDNVAEIDQEADKDMIAEAY